MAMGRYGCGQNISASTAYGKVRSAGSSIVGRLYRKYYRSYIGSF